MLANILKGALIAGGLGLVFGAGLALFSLKFRVEEDPKLEHILALLPGANCGACGFPGCRQLSEAIVNGEAVPTKCTVGGAKIAGEISQIMGIKAQVILPRTARMKCQGDKENAVVRAKYEGIYSCKAASQISGGFKQCIYSCLGLGDCELACPFEAITMVETGLPFINEEKCTSCGLCVSSCPRNVITLIDKEKRTVITCASVQRGPDVRKACKVGCIKCGVCVKNCPKGAIHLDPILGNLAIIDYNLCDNCGTCVEKCPTHTIVQYMEVTESTCVS